MLLNRFTSLFATASKIMEDRNHRYGQALMSALHTVDKEAYLDIITVKMGLGGGYHINKTQCFQRVDPFYDDELIPIFLAHLVYRWRD